MKRKINIQIYKDAKKINLTKISFNTAIRFVKLGLWGTSFSKDKEATEFIRANKDIIIQFLETMAMEINDEEAFTLVDVQTKDAVIKIDIL